MSEYTDANISLKDIYKNANTLYNNHSSSFVKLSLLMVAIYFVMNSLSFWQYQKGIPDRNMLVDIFLIAGSFFLIYWTVRLILGIVFIFSTSIKGKVVSIEDALDDSKISFWDYILGTFIVGLICFMPLLLMSIMFLPNFKTIIETFGRGALVIVPIVFGIIAILLNGAVGYLPYIKVFKSGEDKGILAAASLSALSMRSTFMILNANILVLILIVLVNGLVSLLAGEILGMITGFILSSLFLIAIFPRLIGAIVISYFELSEYNIEGP